MVECVSGKEGEAGRFEEELSNICWCVLELLEGGGEEAAGSRCDTSPSPLMRRDSAILIRPPSSLFATLT